MTMISKYSSWVGSSGYPILFFFYKIYTREPVQMIEIQTVIVSLLPQQYVITKER